MKNLEALSCTISLKAGGQSISKAASIPFLVQKTRDGSMQKWELLLPGTTPYVSNFCLP